MPMRRISVVIACLLSALSAVPAKAACAAGILPVIATPQGSVAILANPIPDPPCLIEASKMDHLVALSEEISAAARRSIDLSRSRLVTARFNIEDKINSQLLTKGLPSIAVFDFEMSNYQATVLAADSPGIPKLPTAVIIRVRPPAQALVKVYLIVREGGATSPDAAAFSTLEALYARILEMPANARFDFVDQTLAKHGLFETSEVFSQSTLLIELAELRRKLLQKMGESRFVIRPKTWSSVHLSFIENPISPNDHPLAEVSNTERKLPLEPSNYVAVRVAPSPLAAGATVFFARTPHSTCFAHVGKDGIAGCELIDNHGHSHEHEHGTLEGLQHTTATFSGILSENHVVLPISIVTNY